jgi:hypothetical protein
MVTLINRADDQLPRPPSKSSGLRQVCHFPNPPAWYPVPPKRGALRNATAAATTSATMTMNHRSGTPRPKTTASQGHRHAARAHERAAERHVEAAELHERVADVLDEHGRPERAQAHRDAAEQDREAAVDDEQAAAEDEQAAAEDEQATEDEERP